MPDTFIRDTIGGDVFTTSNPKFWTSAEYVRLSKSEGKAAMVAQSAAKLRAILSPGDTVYTVLRHVSASGMSRRIDLYVFRDNAPVYLSGYAADVLTIAKPHPSKQGLVIGGCGMDMGFHLVYGLASKLFPVPQGATQEGPPPGASERDQVGGYALRHAWL